MTACIPSLLSDDWPAAPPPRHHRSTLLKELLSLSHSHNDHCGNVHTVSGIIACRHRVTGTEAIDNSSDHHCVLSQNKAHFLVCQL